MATRKIKDAKDLSTNELIYFKGHAQATYMSNGTTVEDAINNIKVNGGGGGNIDLSDYETKEDSISKLQESKDYTDTKTDELRDVVTQTLSLTSGTNWCSFYVDITLEQLQQALGTNATSITTSYDGGETEVKSTYNANTNTWSGDLTVLDVTKMYIINANTACEISLTGKKIPNSIRYILNPGWNWIGYPVRVSVSVKDALANHTPQDGDMIKSINQNEFSQYYAGLGWWPSFNLQPGEGYKYYNASIEPNTLVFTTELIDTKSELNKKQDVLVSGTNIKTVNGESLLGEGNIVIEGGNSSNTKTPIIRTTVNNGDCYVEVDTKTYITCEGNANIFLKQYEDDEYVHSYEIVLLMGESTYSISFPNDVKWIKPLTITENTRYNIIIEDNIATWVSIQN